MKLNSLKPVKGSIKNRKRRGRGHGSGLGKSAGRGDKGAGQRSRFKKDLGLKWTNVNCPHVANAWLHKYLQKRVSNCKY